MLMVRAAHGVGRTRTHPYFAGREKLGTRANAREISLSQAKELRRRKVEFLRLQMRAVQAGYLPASQAISPETLQIPTTSVGVR